MAEPQSFHNHARFDPKFHLFAAPVLLINVFVALGVLIHRWPNHILLHAWLVVVAVALASALTISRLYALKVQDRVIRLEEQLRYQRLLSPEQVALAQALSVGQMIALRFASDAELPALIQRALAEKLEPKAIKQSIVSWRADTFRV